jgi:hypothetical protein
VIVSSHNLYALIPTLCLLLYSHNVYNTYSNCISDGSVEYQAIYTTVLNQFTLATAFVKYIDLQYISNSRSVTQSILVTEFKGKFFTAMVFPCVHLTFSVYVATAKLSTSSKLLILAID